MSLCSNFRLKGMVCVFVCLVIQSFLFSQDQSVYMTTLLNFKNHIMSDKTDCAQLKFVLHMQLHYVLFYSESL